MTVLAGMKRLVFFLWLCATACSITNHFDTLARLDYTALLNRWGHVLDGYSYNFGKRTVLSATLSSSNRPSFRIDRSEGENAANDGGG